MINDKTPVDYTAYDAVVDERMDKLVSNNMRPYCHGVHMIHTSTTASTEWIIGNATDLVTAFSGSYDKVDVVSASTDDKSAATGHVRAVKIWGIDQYYNYRVEEISISGTTAVSSTNSYRAINAVWASSWGSGGNDAKGSITVGPTGKVTDVVATISANRNSNRSARVWIPKKWRCAIVHFVGSIADNTSPNIASGITFQPQYTDDYANADPDYDSKVAIFGYQAQEHCCLFSGEYGSDSTISKLTFFGECTNNGYNGDSFYLGVHYALWATKSIAGTSQTRYMQGV